MAWRVPRSLGRAPDRPRAGRPAAMAPEVTTTTRWPCERRPATSAHSLSTAATAISPRSSVIDELPILMTTIIGRRSFALVLEGEGADVDGVAVGGAGPGEGAVDAEALQAVLHVGDG